jgi:hypothetical protein
MHKPYALPMELIIMDKGECDTLQNPLHYRGTKKSLRQRLFVLSRHHRWLERP